MLQGPYVAQDFPDSNVFKIFSETRYLCDSGLKNWTWPYIDIWWVEVCSDSCIIFSTFPELKLQLYVLNNFPPFPFLSLCSPGMTLTRSICSASLTVGMSSFPPGESSIHDCSLPHTHWFFPREILHPANGNVKTFLPVFRLWNSVRTTIPFDMPVF